MERWQVHALNTEILVCEHIYALPKIWFRCHSLELRAGDFTKINSTIKSWLYADMLEKPEELVMFRPKWKGGLNVQNVKYKAQAILIKSFLETAPNLKFINILFYKALYKLACTS